MKHLYKKLFLLSASLSGLVTLSACDVWNAFTGEKPPPIVAIGPRHVPPLNNPPSGQAQANQAAPMVQGAPVQPVPPPSEDKDPFDYYDASGNPATPQTAASPPSSSSSSGSFFDWLLGTTPAEQAPPAAAKQAMRKPLPENPYYPVETTPTAPPPPAPQTGTIEAPAGGANAPAPGTDTAPGGVTPLLQTPQAAAPADEPEPVAAAPVAVPPGKDNAPNSTEGSWFSGLFGSDDTVSPSAAQGQWPKDQRGPQSGMNTVLPTNGEPQADMATTVTTAPSAPAPTVQNAPSVSPPATDGPTLFDRLTGEPEEPPLPQGMKVGIPKNASYPDLSSVPPVPAQFQAIKDEKQQQMQDLQNEHDLAQQEKQQLDSEPSQQQTQTPVNVPPAGTVPVGNSNAISPANSAQVTGSGTMSLSATPTVLPKPLPQPGGMRDETQAAVPGDRDPSASLSAPPSAAFPPAPPGTYVVTHIGEAPAQPAVQPDNAPPANPANTAPLPSPQVLQGITISPTSVNDPATSPLPASQAQ